MGSNELHGTLPYDGPEVEHSTFILISSFGKLPMTKSLRLLKKCQLEDYHQWKEASIGNECPVELMEITA